MISPLAHVDPSAKIGKNVTVYPFAYIDKNVEIGDNCTIMPYASVLDGTRMGTGNTVYQSAILGAAPQDFKFKGEDTILVIGNDNTIREKAIVNRATYPDGVTSIGDGNFLLEGVHVAHDSKSKLGKIKFANQGQFSISDRDANTPYIKTVRVVTSVDYYLKD